MRLIEIICNNDMIIRVSLSVLPGNLAELVRDPNGNILVQTIRNDIVSRRLTLNASGDGLSGLNLHLLRNNFNPVLGNRPENTRENQGVVYLIFEIAAAATVDSSTRSLGIFWQNFGDWIGEGEDYAFLRHLGDPVTT